ncbi:hypothetical protein [Bradyrhizobium sp. 195]|uniref:hypothetical protein n=1 Tax=Bradyrhizobium sp. 195 TaxID=2782662 RepID=UPI002000C185|nr:hypothetical protein [Bradyrhizobium sp. 195]UPK28245.1 hypothetical protein IVB26_07155 [Bradyrhizobium sp. 195]
MLTLLHCIASAWDPLAQVWISIRCGIWNDQHVVSNMQAVCGIWHKPSATSVTSEISKFRREMILPTVSDVWHMSAKVNIDTGERCTPLISKGVNREWLKVNARLLVPYDPKARGRCRAAGRKRQADPGFVAP